MGMHAFFRPLRKDFQTYMVSIPSAPASEEDRESFGDCKSLPCSLI